MTEPLGPKTTPLEPQTTQILANILSPGFSQEKQDALETLAATLQVGTNDPSLAGLLSRLTDQLPTILRDQDLPEGLRTAARSVFALLDQLEVPSKAATPAPKPDIAIQTAACRIATEAALSKRARRWRLREIASSPGETTLRQERAQNILQGAPDDIRLT